MVPYYSDIRERVPWGGTGHETKETHTCPLPLSVVPSFWKPETVSRIPVNATRAKSADPRVLELQELLDLVPAEGSL